MVNDDLFNVCNVTRI